MVSCPMAGVVVRELTVRTDARGWLLELYRIDELEQEFLPVMGYVSMTRPGVVRGPHEHVDQADYFVFMGPSTFRVYLWDQRADSKTLGQSWQIDAGIDRKVAMIVPPGVVHAYKNVGDQDGIVYNAPNRLYAGAGRREPVDEIRHEDDPQSRFRIDS